MQEPARFLGGFPHCISLGSLRTDAGVNVKLMTPLNRFADRSVNCEIGQESDSMGLNNHVTRFQCGPKKKRKKEQKQCNFSNTVCMAEFALQRSHVMYTAMLCESHAMSGIALV